MDISLFAAGADFGLKDEAANVGFKIIHATDALTLKSQLADWAGTLADEVFILVVDFRGANAGGVFEFQAGFGSNAELPPLTYSKLWTWEVFEDQTAAGMQAQIDRWLAAIRANVALLDPVIMQMINAGAGNSSKFMTVIAWADVGEAV